MRRTFAPLLAASLALTGVAAAAGSAVADPPPATTYTLSVVAGIPANDTSGAPTAGPATSSNLNTPKGVAVDSSGNFYIADSANYVVEKVDAVTGDLSIVAGTGTAGAPSAGPATSSNLSLPTGVAVDPSGNLYIADSTSQVVEKVDAATGDLSVIAGTGTYGTPTAGPATSSNLAGPQGVAVDSSGNVYIADSSNSVVEKVDAVTGDLSFIAGTGTNGTPTAGPATSSDLALPAGVAVDSSGNFYIADPSNSLVEKVDAATGNLSIIAGNGFGGIPTPGPATNSYLAYPYGVAVDSAGQVYIGDYPNNVVEKLVPDAVTKSTLSIADTSVFEGNHGATLRFPVTLSHPVAQDTTVHYATSNGTAVSGSDYRATSGTLTIPAGSSTGAVRVDVVSDKVREPNETLKVTLSSPDNATLARSSAVGTIRNDDTAVSISLRRATEDRVRVLVATGPVARGASVTIYRVGRHGGLVRLAHTRLTSTGRLSIRLWRHYRDGTRVRFVAVVATSHGLYSSRRAAITVW